MRKKEKLPFAKKVFKIIPWLILIFSLSLMSITLAAHKLGYKFVPNNEKRFGIYFCAGFAVICLLCIIAYNTKPRITTIIPCLLPLVGLGLGFIVFTEVQANINTRFVIMCAIIFIFVFTNIFCTKGKFLKVFSSVLCINVAVLSVYFFENRRYIQIIDTYGYYNIENIIYQKENNNQVVIVSDLNRRYSVYYSNKIKNIKWLMGDFVKVKGDLLVDNENTKPVVKFKDKITVSISGKDYKLIKNEPS